MKFYLGTFAGAVAIFFWGFVMWALLSMNLGIIKPLPKSEPVLQAFKDAEVTTGVYAYRSGTDPSGKPDPGPVDGPYVRLFYNGEAQPSQARMMMLGFLHMLLAAAVMATLTRCVLSWADFKARYAFVVAVGMFAAVWIDLSGAIWFGAPWEHQLFVAAYDTGAWILAGLPIAWGTGAARRRKRRKLG